MFNANFRSSRRLYVKSKRSRKRFYLLVITLLIIFFYFKFINFPTNKKIAVIPTPTPTPFPTPTFAPLDNSLSSIVNASFNKENGIFGVVVVNLKDDKSYFYNENKKFDSASLYKLWVMAVAYQKISQGSLKLTDTISDDVSHLNEIFQIDEENAEKKEGKISMSVSEALDNMIRISDNYSALLLTKTVGVSTLQNFLNQYGLSNSKVGVNGKNPITTSYDTFLFYSLLYNNHLPYSSEMITLLKRQALNEKIPKLLPPLTTVAHKTGELDKFSHDAGIVYGPNSDYIIVVLTETKSPQLANEAIANISKNVYDYFEEK